MINAKSQELNIWLEWAKKKADWYDPMMENSDELNDIDMESLTF
jgi:dsDNA-binding SOS-regulon protein